MERQRAATQKRELAEKKIEAAKQTSEAVLRQQRMEFEEREKKAEAKRYQYELSRERERQEIAQRSLAKSVEMQKVFQ